MPKYGKDQDGRKWVWWELVEIRCTREQVEWLYPYMLILREGSYPKDPTESGYIDANIQKTGVKPKARFISPSEIAAEIDLRALHCWPDGELLEHFYVEGKTIEDIARAHYISEDDCWNRMQRALSYIASGPCERWITNEKRKGLEYGEWKLNHWRPTNFRNHRIRVS